MGLKQLQSMLYLLLEVLSLPTFPEVPRCPVKTFPSYAHSAIKLCSISAIASGAVKKNCSIVIFQADQHSVHKTMNSFYATNENKIFLWSIHALKPYLEII